MKIVRTRRLKNPSETPADLGKGPETESAQGPAKEMIRSLVHQMSQPLTVLLGEVELALRCGRSEEELRSSLERCSASLDLLAKAVTDCRAAIDQWPEETRNTPFSRAGCGMGDHKLVP